MDHIPSHCQRGGKPSQKLTRKLERDLFDACVRGNFDRVRELVAMGVKIHADKEAALRTACVNHHDDCIRFLLENGADITHRKCRFLLGAYIFNIRADHRGVEMVKLLLDYGADIHYNNDEALFRASQFGGEEIVRVLLDYGANLERLINQKKPYYDTYDYRYTKWPLYHPAVNDSEWIMPFPPEPPMRTTYIFSDPKYIPINPRRVIF